MTNITGQVAGKSVSHVAQSDPRCLEIHFTDDSVLAIALRHNHIVASLTDVRTDATSGRGFDGPQPTRRQREYLEFIAKYTSRYGVSPAESDIARHFLVSAPSVNQMVQTLERQRFITRQRGVPRSITIIDHRPKVGPLHEARTAGGLRPNTTLHRTGARIARSGR